jgi:hypothetical protein
VTRVTIPSSWCRVLPQAPLVYQLFGDALEPGSLVLSDNDLLDFLIAIVSERPPLPNSLVRALKRRPELSVRRFRNQALVSARAVAWFSVLGRVVAGCQVPSQLGAQSMESWPTFVGLSGRAT